MLKASIVKKGMCLALAASFLIPCGAAAAAAPPLTGDRNVVTGAELYTAMSARISEDAASREALQNLLQRSEVQRVATRFGLDANQVRDAVSMLSGEDLRSVAHQAQRVDEALAGGSTVVVTSTALIIGLLVLIIVLVA